MYDYATNKPYQFMLVDVLKNEVWKWGGDLQPEHMWSKFNEDGSFNEPFQIPSREKKEIEDAESSGNESA